jgi:hypothetical protein
MELDLPQAALGLSNLPQKQKEASFERSNVLLPSAHAHAASICGDISESSWHSTIPRSPGAGGGKDTTGCSSETSPGYVFCFNTWQVNNSRQSCTFADTMLVTNSNNTTTNVPTSKCIFKSKANMMMLQKLAIAARKYQWSAIALAPI